METKLDTSQSTIDLDTGEINLEYLTSYLTATSSTLLNIN